MPGRRRTAHKNHCQDRVLARVEKVGFSGSSLAIGAASGGSLQHWRDHRRSRRRHGGAGRHGHRDPDPRDPRSAEDDRGPVQPGLQANRGGDADARVDGEEPAPDARRGDRRGQRRAGRRRLRHAVGRDGQGRLPGRVRPDDGAGEPVQLNWSAATTRSQLCLVAEAMSNGMLYQQTLLRLVGAAGLSTRQACAFAVAHLASTSNAAAVLETSSDDRWLPSWCVGRIGLEAGSFASEWRSCSQTAARRARCWWPRRSACALPGCLSGAACCPCWWRVSVLIWAKGYWFISVGFSEEEASVERRIELLMEAVKERGIGKAGDTVVVLWQSSKHVDFPNCIKISTVPWLDHTDITRILTHLD